MTVSFWFNIGGGRLPLLSLLLLLLSLCSIIRTTDGLLAIQQQQSTTTKVRGTTTTTTFNSRLTKTTTSSRDSPPTRLFGYLDSLNTLPENIPTASYPISAPPAPAEPTPTATTASNTFEHVPILSLNQADAIVNAAITVCQRNGFNPVTVVVLDASGSTLVSKRMDGCSPVGVQQFAFSKAYSCLVNKYPSRAFRDRYTAEPNQAAKFCQMTSMVAISGNQMAPFPGGILLMAGEKIIGAVGVSGAAGDEDEYCAIQGVFEANIGGGLTTIPEQHSCSTVKD